MESIVTEMRLRVIIILLLALTGFVASGQDNYRVLDWKGDQSVYTWLMAKARSQFDERRVRFQRALRDETSAHAYRDSVLKSYKKILGDLPSRTPLNVRTIGVIDGAKYKIEKVLFESIPGHHVTTNLYLPKRKGKMPGVLLLCGHEDESKATISYQKTAALLALNGFVVLVVDPMSQSERHQLVDEHGKAMTRGGTTEHTLINAVANLAGSGTVAFQLWDNVRALDYLVSRKEVDADRIGCLGNSGGGTQTAYLAAFDGRIKVASVCSYLTSRERTLELSGPNDGCQHVVGEGKALLEMSDFLIAFAPRPMLVLAGSYDFVDYAGTVNAFKEVSSFYSALGHSDRAVLFTAEDGHGITKPKRERVASFFLQWLQSKKVSVVEEEIQTYSADQLNVSGKSQLAAAIKDEVNDFQRVLSLVNKSTPTSDLRSQIQTLNNLRFPSPEATVENVGEVVTYEVSMRKSILRDPLGVPLPMLIFNPGSASRAELWISGKGKKHIADSAALLKRCVDDKVLLIIADVSGVGELRDAVAANDPKYFNREYRNAMIALHVGTSMPAVRTQDILRLAQYIRQGYGVNQTELYSDGICSLPAMQAAIIDENISKVTVTETPSLRNVVAEPLVKDWYSLVIPGVLLHYDVPDLERNLKTRLEKHQMK